MYIKIPFTGIIFFLCILNYSSAEAVGRRFTSCGFLMKKGIYCFGGAKTVADRTDPRVLFLDIVNNNKATPRELEANWTIIPSEENGIPLRNMRNSQTAVLDDDSVMLINGGYNNIYNNTDIKTVGFNAKINTWVAYPSYSESNNLIRQIFDAASVYIPDFGVAFYGGREDNPDPNWTLDGINASAYNDPSFAHIRNIGYTNLTFFDIRKNSPWYIFSVQSNRPKIYPNSQQAIFDYISEKIFFIGGWYYEREIIYIPFENAITFDLTSGTWGTRTLSGVNKPSSRGFFSLTSLIHTFSGRDVLLYGGRRGTTWSQDYLYTFNLDTYEWRHQMLSPGVVDHLVRADHSAVLVNKTLYILFGEYKEDSTLSSVIILNVTDPYQISFSDSSIGHNSTSDLGNKSDHNANSGLSTGATIGVAVGTVVAGVLTILTVVFLIRKKKKNKEAKIPEMEEVNWEEIEKSYQVITTPSSNSYNIPPFQIRDNTVDATNNTTNITNNLEGKNVIIARPDVHTEIVLPDSGLPNKSEKPDGGY